MARSFFTSNTDSVLASGSAIFSARILESASSYGLSNAQAEAYAALDAIWQVALRLATDPSTRTVATVTGKNLAREPIRKMASNLAQIINGTPTVTDAQKIILGISVREKPTARPAPGMPSRFAVSLETFGELTLTWKCKNPRGSSGTMYQIWRRVGPTGAYEYLGGVGTKKFVDRTIPAGSAQVTYKVQAVRSTAVGTPALHIVNFGVSMPARGQAVPMKQAA